MLARLDDCASCLLITWVKCPKAEGRKSVTNLVRLCHQMKPEKYNVE